MMSKRPPLTVLEALGTLAGLGFTIAIPIAVLTIGGYYLDGITHTKPIFLLLGLLLGLISGIYGAYRLLSRVLQRG
jgi:ATP synthase protein I